MKSLLAPLTLALLLLSSLPAAADPLGQVTLTAVRPIATFEATKDGGLVTWIIPVPPVEGYTQPDGYRVYRHVFEEGAPTDGLEAQYLGTVPYHAGPQIYSYLDETYSPEVATIYYVRAVLNSDEGLPSNPVGDYPPCDWASVGTQAPYVSLKPECLIPDL